MSDAAPAPEPTVSTDPAVLRAEERLAALRELREIGMNLARALERRVMAEPAVADPVQDETPPAPGARERDPADAFSRLSRAIRLTITLEATTDEALRDLAAGVTRAREETTLAAAEQVRAAADQAVEDRLQERHDRIDRIYALVLEAPDKGISLDQFERLERELDERFGWPDSPWNDPAAPLRPVVEEIFRHFRLTPDWSRWGVVWDEAGDREGWTHPLRPAPAAWPWEQPGEADDDTPIGSGHPSRPNGAGRAGAVHDLE